MLSFDHSAEQSALSHWYAREELKEEGAAVAGGSVLFPRKLPVNAVRPLIAGPKVSHREETEKMADLITLTKPNGCLAVAGKVRQT